MPELAEGQELVRARLRGSNGFGSVFHPAVVSLLYLSMRVCGPGNEAANPNLKTQKLQK